MTENQKNENSQPTCDERLSKLMQLNAQMFEGTIRVLGAQNSSLHQQLNELQRHNDSLHSQLCEQTRLIEALVRDLTKKTVTE